MEEVCRRMPYVSSVGMVHVLDLLLASLEVLLIIIKTLLNKTVNLRIICGQIVLSHSSTSI